MYSNSCLQSKSVKVWAEFFILKTFQILWSLITSLNIYNNAGDGVTNFFINHHIFPSLFVLSVLIVLKSTHK